MKALAPGKRFDLTTANGVTELEAHVQCRLSGQVRDLRLIVQGKALILKRHTHTYHAKPLAQRAVMKATDLPIRANEIDVS